MNELVIEDDIDTASDDWRDSEDVGTFVHVTLGKQCLTSEWQG